MKLKHTLKNRGRRWLAPRSGGKLLSKNIKVAQVGFEMTRRCNMKCKFCSRGDAQNLDITEEIIDKALDELKNFDIGILRLHGGEPLLAPDMIQYLVAGIIKRNIKVYQCLFFSNGTVCNAVVKASLDKIGKYCKDKSDKGLSDYMNNFTNTYNVIAPCSIIVSDYEHEKIDYEKFKKYYDSQYTEVCKQEEKYIGNDKSINIEGKAKDNLQYYIDNGYTELDIFEDKNKFCIIDDAGSELTMNKGFTISANGNVYVGCSQSYIELDRENICNIMQCNGNLYGKINQWCWKYPLHLNQQIKRNNLRSMIFRYEHGLQSHDWLDGKEVNEESYEFIKKVLSFYCMMEDYIRQYHKLYPMMSHFETQALVMYEFAKGVSIKYRNIVMAMLSLFNNKVEKDIDFSDAECDSVINRIRSAYIKRAYGIDNNTYNALCELSDLLSVFQ